MVRKQNLTYTQKMQNNIANATQNNQNEKQELVFRPNEFYTINDIWVMDETFFSKKCALCLVVHVKTTAIMGGCAFKVDKNSEKFAFLDSFAIENLYQGILESGNPTPQIIHTDKRPEYQNPNLIEFMKKHNIFSSVSGKNQNQLVEAINHQMKAIVIQQIFNTYQNNHDFHAFSISIPTAFKKLSVQQKSTSKKFRDFFFNSTFFLSLPISDIIMKSIDEFNGRKSKVSNTGYDRGTLVKLNACIAQNNSFIQGDAFSITGSFIRQMNDEAYNQVVDHMAEILQNPYESSENKMELIDG
jgi:hypothetical protein